MNFNIIKTAGKFAVKIGSKVGLKLKKASPEICLAGGVALVIGGTVMAVKASKKADGIMDEANAVMGQINKEQEEFNTAEGEEIDIHEEKRIRKEFLRDKTSLVIRTTGKLIKTYGPAVAAEGLGIALIFCSHGIMRKRNMALLGAYNALDGAFRRYRGRIRERLGEEEENDIYLGKKHVQLINADGEDVQRVVYDDEEPDRINNMDSASDIYKFNRFTSYRWSASPILNLQTLRSVESLANDRYRAQKTMFVNEILDLLGMERTSDGAIRGWIFDKDDPDSQFIDFGLCEDLQGDAWKADEDSLKKDIIIHFNTHGLIWDKI